MNDSQQGTSEWPVIRLPLKLSSDSVHVIRVRLDPPESRSHELNGILSIDERERAARFRFDEPRQRFVTCRATLRMLLGNCCGIAPDAVVLRYGAYGKPELARGESGTKLPEIEFSVSHSGNLGLIAVSLGAVVGIDIEECNPAVKILKLAERFFAPTEFEELRNLPPEKQLSGFYRGWTCKEAYIKATGRGMSLRLSSFCVGIDPDQPASLKHVDDDPSLPQRWTTSSLHVPDNYAAAIMVESPDCRVQCWDWQPN